MQHAQEGIRPDTPPPWSRSWDERVLGPGFTFCETPRPHTWTLRGRVRRPWAAVGHLSVGISDWDETAGAGGRCGPPCGTLVTLPATHKGQVTLSFSVGGPGDAPTATWTRGQCLCGCL